MRQATLETTSSTLSVRKRPRNGEDEQDEDGADIKPPVRPRVQQPAPIQLQVPAMRSARSSTGPQSSLNLHGIPKHEEFYYEDGTVVFVTTQYTTSPAKVFRVYRRQLEKHSPKLRAILGEAFRASQPGTNPVETFEGCPVLRLAESTGDLEALFETLWGGLFSSAEDRSSQFVMGVLRMSTKWDIPQVREWSLNLLTAKIPTTYDVFVKDPNLYIFWKWIAPANVLQLHREFGLPQMAAIAWYYLSTVSWENQPAPVKNYLPLSLLPTEAPSSVAALPIDADNLIIGRERIQARCIAFLYSDDPLLKFDMSPCTASTPAGQPCQSMDLKKGEKGKESLTILLRYPLFWAQMFAPHWAMHLCSECNIQLMQAAENFTKKLFEDLPTLFKV